MGDHHQKFDGKKAADPSNDWRQKFPGIQDKLRHVLANCLLTDVTFVVGKNTGSDVEKFQAHRFVLSVFSSVFEAMFASPANTSDPVEVPDVTPLAFKAMLNFINIGHLESDLCSYHLTETLYAAKKYEIKELGDACVKLLREKLNCQNAVTIFQAAQKFGENRLRDEVCSFIKSNFATVIKSQSFLEMSHENLCLFLKDDDVDAKEIDIFLGLKRWATAECERKEMKLTPENQRDVVSEAVNYIRFPNISSSDIAMEVISSGILTMDECARLLQYKALDKASRNLLPPLPFNTYHKLRRISYNAQFCPIPNEKDGADFSNGSYNRFSADQPIYVISVGFYGPNGKESAVYDFVRVQIFNLETNPQLDVCLGEFNEDNVVWKRDEVNHVKFASPVPIKANDLYRISFAFKGPRTRYGKDLKKCLDVPVQGDYEKVNFKYLAGCAELCEIKFHL